ncbi:MAG: VWA domain-containing protein [Bacteroidales bacterium]|jgi:Ca-activated chloride channel family protein|nr:VWA domain-containing protein [Bacteroidales bacterium]
MKKVFIIILLHLIFIGAAAQPVGVKITKSNLWQKTRILFIIDCSKSMGLKWQSDTKIKITQTLISNIIDSLHGRENVEFAVRTFGGGENDSKETCTDSRLEVAFSKNNFDVVKAKLKALVPKGNTPLAYSIKRSEDDFPYCENCRNIVILITDGTDDCNEDPCEISTNLQQNGKIHKPFVIGIGALQAHLECIGNYFETNNEIEFSQVLNNIIAQLLDKTTCQVNLLDAYMEANETNVPITFYDHYSQLPKYTYMHTFNSKGLSDTLTLDPLLAYDLVVHTIPEVKIENIKLLPAKHTIIPVQVPQGSLIVKFTGKNGQNTGNPPMIIVRQAKTNKTLNTQNINETVKYITGTYDIEILTQPRLNLDSIEISRSAVTTIEIPMTGIAQINKGNEMLGAIFVKEDGHLRLVCGLNPNLANENFSLLPGEYVVVLRPQKSVKTLQTITQDFKIESSQNTTVRCGN